MMLIFSSSFCVTWQPFLPASFPQVKKSILFTCKTNAAALTHKITANHSENTTAKQEVQTDTDSFSYFNIHLLFSSHKSLQKQRVCCIRIKGNTVLPLSSRSEGDWCFLFTCQSTAACLLFDF